jgi:lipoyl synthase
MLGLGETHEEVFELMDDLAAHGCDVMTIGQYLQPTKLHLEVKEYVTPEVFEMYKEEGLKRGLSYVESGPLVRSSYHAERHI